MRRWFSLALLVAAIVLGSLLGVLNATPAAIDLLFVQAQMPLGLALTLALAVGLLAGSGILWLLRVVPLQHRARRLQRELDRRRNSGDGQSDGQSNGQRDNQGSDRGNGGDSDNRAPRLTADTSSLGSDNTTA